MTAGASKTAADHPRRPPIKRCFALRAPPVGLRPPYAARSARARVRSTLRHRVRGSLLRADRGSRLHADRSEEHTSELQSLMRISYDVFCLKKKKQSTNEYITKAHDTTYMHKELNT